MRNLVACALFLTAAVRIAPAASRVTGMPVAVVLRFEVEARPEVVNALQAEVNRLVRPAHIQIDYVLSDELGAGGAYSELIVVKFKGHCGPTTRALTLDERGPFAFTHITNGEVLPFAEVECDRVRAYLERSKDARVTRNGELLGCALGRIVAHELYHILLKTKHHGDAGVAARTMRSKDLHSAPALFEGSELRKLHQWNFSRH